MFKRILTAIICFQMVFSYNIVNATDSADSISMVINESQIIKNIDKEMYGINFEWGKNGDGSGYYLKNEENSLETNPEYVECFNDYMPFSRMAGMSANSMYWKKAIGTMSERENLQFWYYEAQKQRFGPVEWIKGNKLADEDTKFAYTVNLKDIDNLADLVRFLTLEPTDSKAIGTDGVNWAQRRVDLGITEPVDIKVWELGNEVDCSTNDGGFSWNILEYIYACNNAIEAIRSVDPEAKISAHIKSDYWVSGWESWHRMLLNSLGEKIDYLSVHQYYNWQQLSIGNNVFNTLETDIQEYTGSDRIKIFVSEHAADPIVDTWENSFDYMLPHTLGGTLATAEFYLRSAMRPSIEMATYHSTDSASWVTAYEFQGDVKLTAIGNLMHIMLDNFCGDVIQTQVEGFSIDDDSKVIGGAVKTNDGINVMLINRNESAVNIDFDFENEYDMYAKSFITGLSNESDNYQVVNKTTGYVDINKQEISYAYNEAVQQRNVTSYTIAPLSVVVLNLKEVNNDITSYGVETFSKGYGYDCWKEADNNKVLASTIDGLVGQTIEDSVVGANDWVLKSDISEDDLKKYKEYYNGINNKYTWQQYVDESGNLAYKKLYGGFGGFYGYLTSGEDVQDGTTPRIYAATNDEVGLGKGGSYCIRPGSNKVTYGRYDLNLNGLNKFTHVFKPKSNILNAQLFFVQDGEGYLNNRSRECEIFEIDRLGQVKLEGSGTVLCTITKNSYYTLEWWLDTRETEPKCKIGLKQYGGETYLAETDWFSVANFGFDFDKDMGIKLLTEGVDDTTEWLIGEFKLEKIVEPQEETVDAFSKGYGYDCWKEADENKVLASTIDGLVGQTIEGSVVGANDWVLKSDISAENLSKYTAYYNGLNNKYTWQQYVDESGDLAYKKLYGGFGGFYGYCTDGETVQDGSRPRIFATNTETATSSLGKGGPYCLRPGSTTLTYGRYDLNLKGLSKFTQIFRTSNGLLDCDMLLVQDDTPYLNDRAKERKLFVMRKDGSMRFQGSGTIACNVSNNTNYLMECWVDTRGEVPMTKIILKDYATSAIIYETGWDSIATSNFNFDKAMGVKVKVTAGTSDNRELRFAEFKLEKPINISDGSYIATVEVKNNTSATITGKAIAAMYSSDEDEFIDVDIVDVENLASNGTTNVTFTFDEQTEVIESDKYVVKYFIWDGFENITPIGIYDSESVMPTLVCN